MHFLQFGYSIKNLTFDKKDGIFTSGDMRMSSDLKLIYMAPRKPMAIVKYEHFKFSIGA